MFLGSLSVTFISLSLILMLLQAYSMSEEEVQRLKEMTKQCIYNSNVITICLVCNSVLGVFAY